MVSTLGTGITQADKDLQRMEHNRLPRQKKNSLAGQEIEELNHTTS